jgi:nucleoside-diphosphate-sugar epimerase
MNKIFLTGSSGFIGSSFLNHFKEEIIHVSSRGKESEIDAEKIVIHLAGKAHDLKKIQNPAEYYHINTNLTKEIYDAFLVSDANVFITLSSVKAIADRVYGELSEEQIANPTTHYGKSKLLAEQYILSKNIPEGKRVYILRPCLIHGPGNKGNLSLLYKWPSRHIPWPLGAFENKRSFSSIDNLLFIIKELMEREDIPSGIYNVADDMPLSTNEVISIISEVQNRKPSIWKISKTIIRSVAKIGSVLNLSFNEELLLKLTDSYIVSNQKIKSAIGKPLPVSSKDGLFKTFKSFN